MRPLLQARTEARRERTSASSQPKRSAKARRSCGIKSIFAVRNIAPGGNCGHNSCRNNYCAADHCGVCCLALFGTSIAVACCETSFYSEDCKADALSSYHKVLCGKDLSETYQSCGGTNAEKDGIPLVMTQVLAAAVQQNWQTL